jgi:syntaxin-binding protein 1
MASDAPSLNLRHVLAQRLLHDMIDVAQKASGGVDKCVLVVDAHTATIVSSALRVHDLLEAGVLLVQRVELVRQHLPDMSAIYFLQQSDEQLARLAAEARAQYRCAHLFFTGRVPDAGMDLLKTCALDIRTLVELHLDFCALESRVFCLSDGKGASMRVLAQQLASTCQAVTLPDAPLVVRYSAQGQGACHELTDLMQQHASTQASSGAAPPVTLLIVDRAIDALAPLMHEFTFQAMVHELLPVVAGELVSLEESADQDPIVLSEDDAMWTELRHQHIASAMHRLSRLFKDFKSSNKMACLQHTEAAIKAGASAAEAPPPPPSPTMRDLTQAMKDMPAYRATMRQYHKHMALADECMKRFDATHLNQVGDLEQDLATGLDAAHAKPVAIKTAKEQLVRLCQQTGVTPLDKLRLVMLYNATQPTVLPESVCDEILRDVDADLRPAADAARRLADKPSKERSKVLKERALDPDLLKLQRYVPHLHTILSQLVRGQLPLDAYPCVSAVAAAASSALSSATAPRKGVSARKKSTGADNWKAIEGGATAAAATLVAPSTRAQCIVFVLGGMTQSEIRSVYEVADAQHVQLVIGSTHTLAPIDYVRSLAVA